MWKRLKFSFFSFFSFVYKHFTVRSAFFLFFKTLKRFMLFDRRLGEKFYFKYYKKYPKLVNFVFLTSQKWSEDRYFSWLIVFGAWAGIYIFKAYFYVILQILIQPLIKYFNVYYFKWFILCCTKKTLKAHKWWFYNAFKAGKVSAFHNLLYDHHRWLQWFSIVCTICYSILYKYAPKVKFYFLVICFGIIFLIFFLIFFFFFGLIIFQASYLSFHLEIIDTLRVLVYVDSWIWYNFSQFFFWLTVVYYFYNFYVVQFFLYFTLLILIIFCVESFYYYFERVYPQATQYVEELSEQEFLDRDIEEFLYCTKDFLDFFD